MKTPSAGMRRAQEILERKEVELVRVLLERDGIAIESSVDRESSLLRDVETALRRIQDGRFGTCIDCELAISPKRLAAVPWEPRCIHCQNAAGRERADSGSVAAGCALA